MKKSSLDNLSQNYSFFLYVSHRFRAGSGIGKALPAQQKETSIKSISAKGGRPNTVVSLISGLFLVGACSLPPPATNRLLNQASRQDLVSMTPLRWRMGPDCSYDFPRLASSRQRLADGCPADGGGDFVAMAISGGGSKAAAFGGEVMFMLDRFGLLHQLDALSGVSGGSFAAAVYAASCDPNDRACQDHPGRPVWDYEDIMGRLGQGYRPLVRKAYLRLAMPLVPQTIAPAEFADFIDACYLGTQSGNCDFSPRRRPSPPLTFADLNPRRPHLILNSTSVSEQRDVVDDRNDCPFVMGKRLPGEPRGFLRRRNSDEVFHFAFTDFYFRRICSDLAAHRLSDGIGASAAFPVLVDYFRVADFTDRQPASRRQRELVDPASGRRQLLLIDGGANDNQGLMEIYMALAEVMGGQQRSETNEILRFEPLRRDDRVLVFLVNSSLTETTGVQLGQTWTRDPSRGSSLINLFDRSSAAIDTYSAVGYSLRTRLYERELALLNADLMRRWPGWTPEGTQNMLEIGLTVLNHYPQGGFEAARHAASGVVLVEEQKPVATDPDRADFRKRIQTHQDAFARLRSPTARRALGLSNIHPQCLYEKSKGADISLASMTQNQANCLRHAARWATALRVQELCNQQRSNGVHPLNRAGRFDTACDASARLTPLTGMLPEPDPLGDCRLDDPGDPDAEAIAFFLEQQASRRGASDEPDAQCHIASSP